MFWAAFKAKAANYSGGFRCPLRFFSGALKAFTQFGEGVLVFAVQEPELAFASAELLTFTTGRKERQAGGFCPLGLGNGARHGQNGNVSAAPLAGICCRLMFPKGPYLLSAPLALM